MQSFVVGIDLGTTHTVVACAERRAGARARVFDVAQLVGATEAAARPLLASSLYLPPEGEPRAEPLPVEVGAAPGGPATGGAGAGRAWVVGEHAARRGAEVPGRLVASSKSWLSHAAVDRRAGILPWQADDDMPRISPVEAATELLCHVRRAWDAAHRDAPLAAEDVVLTVPASFDAVARELTVEAARAAGLAVRLVEEPQAAFYDFLAEQAASPELGRAFERALRAGAGEAVVLVCDVGGGTTDLSLIRARRRAGADASAPLQLERVAVGRHLLLGGDNMDLALAQRCERRLVPEGQHLDGRRFAELVAAVRRAKEKLLAPGAPESVGVTVLGSGARLLSGALTTTLELREVEELVVEGFFPRVVPGEVSVERRGGLRAFGLPYEREPAVSRHLAAFLARHAATATPTALYLNGGVFHAAAIAARVHEVASALVGRPLVLLPNADPDVAVARGAVAFGLALAGHGPRIGGGSARAYFVGLGGLDGRRVAEAVCVLPRGAPEGVRQRVTGRAVGLTLGRAARFELYASDRGVDALGALVRLDAAEHERLPPAVARLGSPKRQKELAVELEAELTAVGTLELACVEAAPARGVARRFRLAFELRAQTELEADGGGASTGGSRLGPVARPGSGAAPPSVPPAPAPEQSTASAPSGPQGTLAGKRLDEVTALCERAFGPPAAVATPGEGSAEPSVARNLLRELERLLGVRDNWSGAVLRTLSDVLLARRVGRRRSAEHERMFWLLAGYALRPGVGDADDERRVGALFRLLPERVVFSEPRTWQQFWIAWRRVAAGLGEREQRALFDLAAPFVAPPEAKLKKPKGVRVEAPSEMIDALSSLERLPREQKAELGDWIVERTWTDRDPRLWAALGRVGARVPTYGSAHQVVVPSAVERWMDHLLREKWRELPTSGRAALAMCRVTLDRERDLSDALRARVVKKLAEVEAYAPFIEPLTTHVPVTAAERVAFYGDELPVGLRRLE
ncbi:MAG: Hsp70 family protein [Polyangiaceae bacterium]|nr:Hsp70 family protein [Polyangiaceae bacterium]